MKKTLSTLGASLALAFASAGALAQADAARLGKSLTPMGADAAANAANTIPAWTGGLTKPVAGYVQGGHYPDPFGAEKPLFSIDAASAEKYKANLTPGQIALLKKFPTWKMNVYPAHRSATFPKANLDDTIANASRAKLAAGGNGVTGTKGLPY